MTDIIIQLKIDHFNHDRDIHFIERLKHKIDMDNIFDILEIYDFIQEDEKPLKKEEDESGN